MFTNITTTTTTFASSSNTTTTTTAAAAAAAASAAAATTATTPTSTMCGQKGGLNCCRPTVENSTIIACPYPPSLYSTPLYPPSLFDPLSICSFSKICRAALFKKVPAWVQCTSRIWRMWALSVLSEAIQRHSTSSRLQFRQASPRLALTQSSIFYDY